MPAVNATFRNDIARRTPRPCRAAGRERPRLGRRFAIVGGGRYKLHGWVMSGFRATADPATTDAFNVTGAIGGKYVPVLPYEPDHTPTRSSLL